MYRDDRCAVCGESLPPDHFYCREHAVDVDDRLHAIAGLLPAVGDRTMELHGLVDGIAEETWDYVAEADRADPTWPPDVELNLRVDTDQVEVDVDDEPGYVRVRLRLSLAELLRVMSGGIEQASAAQGFVEACAKVSGANATH